MTTQGKVYQILEQKSGINARTGNTWKSLDFVIEIEDRYQTKQCFTLFGSDKVDMANLKVGESIVVNWYAESHEYGGRWFTELRCIDILRNGLSAFVKPMFTDENRA